MIPVNIQDIIAKVTDRKTAIHHRQFYYDTLVKIHKAAEHAIAQYDAELDDRR